MMMESMRSHRGSFLKGLLIGSLAGGVTALLLAPKSGKELRSEFKGKVDEAQALLRKTSEQVKELKKEADRQLSEARLRFKQIFKGGESTPEYTKSEMEGEA
jgi:gas vesicle protein